MTGETWPQGTVAMVTLVVRDEMKATARGDGRWRFDDGLLSVEGAVAAVRPLLVLDPDDTEQMEAFRLALWECSVMADAVRALLPQPAPTKPDEPTGFGARVRLRDGRVAVRCYNANAKWAWKAMDGPPQHWAILDVVEVLDAGEPT